MGYGRQVDLSALAEQVLGIRMHKRHELVPSDWDSELYLEQQMRRVGFEEEGERNGLPTRRPPPGLIATARDIAMPLDETRGVAATLAPYRYASVDTLAIGAIYRELRAQHAKSPRSEAEGPNIPDATDVDMPIAAPALDPSRPFSYKDVGAAFRTRLPPVQAL